MKILSICLWFLALLNVGVYFLGSVAVPIVITTFGVASLSNIVWPFLKNTWKQRKSGRPQRSILKQGLIRQATESIEILGIPSFMNDGDEESLTKPLTKEEEAFLPAVAISSESSDNLRSRRVYTESSCEIGQQKSVSFAPTQALTPSKLKKSEYHGVNVTDEIDGKYVHTSSMSAKARSQSDQVFLILFIACLMVTLWKYPILLLCLVPFAIWCSLKRVIFSTFDQESFFLKTWPGFRDWIKCKQWILFPPPMPTILAAFVYLDKKVLNATKGMIGSLVSAFIIIVMLLLMVTGLVFFFFEIQVELVHYVTVGFTVWNGTVASHLQSSG